MTFTNVVVAVVAVVAVVKANDEVVDIEAGDGDRFEAVCLQCDRDEVGSGKIGVRVEGRTTSMSTRSPRDRGDSHLGYAVDKYQGFQLNCVLALAHEWHRIHSRRQVQQGMNNWGPKTACA
ncbi:hypothetical protein BCR39DRAFT_508333 [Naematelia encephala]|uniref:Secreted protein n=1 Tax=Naematelia encephala TaxID=71784 RepID=A0A1Y2AH89_9TREE|nr:hypothetical protein BCR39DRAFT_508333 [Naematelia encephala]